MVRLKESLKKADRGRCIGFNSEMVRLKEIIVITYLTPLNVSIPKWFD